MSYRVQSYRCPPRCARIIAAGLLLSVDNDKNTHFHPKNRRLSAQNNSLKAPVKKQNTPPLRGAMVVRKTLGLQLFVTIMAVGTDDDNHHFGIEYLIYHSVFLADFPTPIT